ALRIVRRLGLPWSLLYGLKVLPTKLRDKLYDLVAKHRYTFFGKKDQCMIPTPEAAERFLSS
ncbi:MAG: DCC1-like thiol-disulfide oxidoreductase family protein, partial [Acidobacteria bacterium]|nr:DCC1-like thiol-disulfide oxidoreductase family protein [Acidobacteriota bacterium]